MQSKMWPETVLMISRLMREHLLSPRGFTSTDLKKQGLPRTYIAVMAKQGWIERFGEPEKVIGARGSEKRYIQRWVFTSHAPGEVEKLLLKMKINFSVGNDGKI